MFLQLTLLINFVILVCEAQQHQQTPPPTPISLAPQPALPSTTQSQAILSQPGPQEFQVIPQPPTKPPLVQLTKPTQSASSQPDSASTTNIFPPSSFITIDVSQPPATPAPGTIATIVSSLSSTAIATATVAVTSTTTRPPQVREEQPQNEPSSSSNIAAQQYPPPTSSQLQAAGVIRAPGSNIAENQPQTSFQPQNPKPTLSGLASTPSEQISNRASSARSQDFRRPPEGLPLLPMLPPSNGQSSSNINPAPSNTSVQILRARSKLPFKCAQSADCHGGMCNTTIGRCFCPPGFTGESCAINIDECRLVHEPCFNNGICIDEIDSYRCECAPGFKGDRCQDAVDMCLNIPCLNGARCVNHRIDYSCECKPGWEGKNCEKNINECQKNPCQNNGTCYDEINDYRCDCGTSGFTGKNCDVDFDDCAAKPCGFGAKECIDLTGEFKCICYDGFTGKRCDIDIEECQSNPCENNGTCIEKSLGLHHLHNSTSDLTIYHEIRDHNMTNGMNLSQYAGYTCECKEEYYGDRCEEKKKCYTKSVLELCNHKDAECINVGSSYECLINASFDGSGQNFANYRIINEFTMREVYVKYKSMTGGIIMSFETTQPDSNIVDLQMNKSGVYLNGSPIKRDENINFDQLLDGNEHEIRLGLDTPLEIKSITLARQTVNNDYHLPFKGCLMQVRINNQLLPLLDTSVNMTNFELIDNRLEVGHCHTCFEKDCLNGGRCEFDREGLYDHCACTNAFTGTFCEIDVNECERNFGLCHNGGSCENIHGGYRCNCKEGYKGEKCQEISDYCKAKQPCGPGVCINTNLTPLSYHCECPSSHLGKKCERKRDCINECSSHQAQCINNVTCACLPVKREMERMMCEYIASCEQVQGDLCLNGGLCRNLETGGYHCICPEPFYGPICQYIQKPQFDLILLIIVACVGFLMAACAVVTLIVFRSVRRARATRGTYSPSTQEKYGNAASDLLKLPQPERLI